MTFSSANLSTPKKYDGNLRVHIADGGSILTTNVGDVSHPLPLNLLVFFSSKIDYKIQISCLSISLLIMIALLIFSF